jgi:hypothetical protein
MKTAIIGIIVALGLVIIVLLVWPPGHATNVSNALPPGIPSSTTTTPPGTTLALDRSISDGTITVSYPSADFALATTSSQITVTSYIPPCYGDFNYCLYYVGSFYQGTNFESAGLRIDKRSDLTTQTQCLNAQPSGFTGLVPTITTSTDHSVSVFSQVGGAAAGHFASGSLYRLSYKGSCYEFETSIGQSDYENYPSGTIRQFTTTDQADLQSEVNSVLNSLILSGGAKVFFAQ